MARALYSTTICGGVGGKSARPRLNASTRRLFAPCSGTQSTARPEAILVATERPRRQNQAIQTNTATGGRIEAALRVDSLERLLFCAENTDAILAVNWHRDTGGLREDAGATVKRFATWLSDWSRRDRAPRRRLLADSRHAPGCIRLWKSRAGWECIVCTW
ncbi:MAG: hypothetical protein H6644_07195 [Caldilineaceae bacterium]|nr:hypothetical protein [Caldilineaceae bacterium]